MDGQNSQGNSCIWYCQYCFCVVAFTMAHPTIQPTILQLLFVGEGNHDYMCMHYGLAPLTVIYVQHN